MPSKESSIYSKGGIWAKLVEKVKIESKNQQSDASTAVKPDAYLFIVGDRSSGKTTLLNAFLHGEKANTTQVKPTEGLDYTFARKSSSIANVERKDVSSQVVTFARSKLFPFYLGFSRSWHTSNTLFLLSVPIRSQTFGK